MAKSIKGLCILCMISCLLLLNASASIAFYDWGEIAHNIEYRNLHIVLLDYNFGYAAGEIINKRNNPINLTATIIFKEMVGDKVLAMGDIYDLYVPANGSRNFRTLASTGQWEAAKEAYKVIWFIK